MKIFTTSQVAKQLNLDSDTVLHHAKRLRLDLAKIGKAYVWQQSDIDAVRNNEPQKPPLPRVKKLAKVSPKGEPVKRTKGFDPTANFKLVRGGKQK